ncbi:prenyltransferase [Rhizocola hellebori]|uniref:Prenyltransferase n=1 Tax=Rhizocola hellebori TaxID=1392758 RepID=A0A8J3Q2S5_9ACTN|nr:prenyltransferase [Rhizocola hellebori]GIH02654.1 prenyltransferase [Rhizocola hellebori]
MLPDLSQLPHVPGVISATQVRAAAQSIARQQEPSGAIPWYTEDADGNPGHVNAWDHIEAAMALSVAGMQAQSRLAYRWLRDQQRPDGSWPAKWVLGEVAEAAGESNHAAYLATGVWHETLRSGDRAFAAEMWPGVVKAVGYVLSLQQPTGEVWWNRDQDGNPGELALLAGCSSIYHSLRCATALASYMDDPQPDWEFAAYELGQAICHRRDLFADKSRFAMDWYYPVLCGAVTGRAATEHLKAGWDTFVVDRLGCRCVSDEPWITGAETCELIITLVAAGDREVAMNLLRAMQFLRHEDGSYWTGYQIVDNNFWPFDRSTYTAAALVLAVDCLSGTTGAADLFKHTPW